VNGFGPTPPLLTAARWLPTSAMENADLEYDLAMNAKFRFRGALSFTVETKFWINWPRERYASIPLQVREKIKKRDRKRKAYYYYYYYFILFFLMERKIKVKHLK
jgi:hypothetical protein